VFPWLDCGNVSQNNWPTHKLTFTRHKLAPLILIIEINPPIRMELECQMNNEYKVIYKTYTWVNVLIPWCVKASGQTVVRWRYCLHEPAHLPHISSQHSFSHVLHKQNQSMFFSIFLSLEFNVFNEIMESVFHHVTTEYITAGTQMEMPYCAIVHILTKPFSLKWIAGIYRTQDSGTRQPPSGTLPLRPRTPVLAASFRPYLSWTWTTKYKWMAFSVGHIDVVGKWLFIESIFSNGQTVNEC